MPATAALKPASARIDQVLNSFAMAMAMAITNDGIPVEVDVIVGKPEPEDIKQILATEDGAFVYIETQAGAKQEPNYARFNRYREVFTPPTLTASFANPVLRFDGEPTSDLNVHVIGGWPTVDAYYKTTDADVDLPTVTANVAQACTTAGLANTVSGETITFETPVTCNIGATGSIVREVMKLRQRFKAIVLARSADDEVSPQLGLRSAIGHAIISQIGTMASDNLPLDDGTIEIIRHIDNWFVDKPQSDFGVVEYHLLYEIMYGILEVTPATQVGSFGVTIDPNGSATLRSRIYG